MKNRMFVASFAALAIAGTASANVTVVTDANLADYTGASSISIPAGDTLQFSGISSAYTLSAPISGGGTLLMDGCTGVATLAGDNSFFSGALVATNSSVTVGHVNALGSATVGFVAADAAATYAFLYGVTGEFSNSITVERLVKVDGTIRYSVATGCTVTNSGNVVFYEASISSSKRRIEIGPTAAQQGRLVLTGSLRKTGYTYIYGPITLAAAMSNSSLGNTGSFFFNSDCDAIFEKDVTAFFGNSGMQCAKGTLHFAAEDCFPSKPLVVGTTSSPEQNILLDGHDQHFLTVKSVKGTDNNEYKTERKVYNSSAPATMTIKHNFSNGVDANQGWGRLRGKLSFAFDSDGTSGAYCGINTYGTSANDTDGSITAINGTIHLGDNMRFTALTSLVVTNAGSIALATGQFNDTCDVYLSGSGKLILSNNVTLTVNRVFYKAGDEFAQANAGDYTKGQDGLAAYLDGEGMLTVLTSPPVTEIDYHWTSEGDTSLAAAANWQENASPNLTDGTAYLHFNSGSSAADAAGDIAVYGLDFTRGTDFAFGGAGNTVSVGLGGVTVANTDGEAAHAVTIAPKLNIAEFSPWTVGGNSSLVLSGGLSTVVSGAALTISGGETAASGNSVTFAGDSSESPMSVVVTNVEKVVVASDTALPVQGLVMYDKLPDFSSVTSNGAPVEIRDIAHNFSNESEVFWSNGVFRQTGLFTLRSRSATSGHRAQIHIKGGEVQFLGGIECDGARQGFWLYGDAKMRIAGTLKDCGQDIEFRGRTSGKMNEIRSAAKTTDRMRTMHVGRVTFVCEAENVLPYGDGTAGSPGISLGIQSDYGLETVFSQLDLNGYDQQLNYMTCPAYASMTLIEGAHAVITSAVPATLTLKRGAGNALINKFTGAVNLTVDSGASGVKNFTLSNVVSTTTGELLVKSGSLTFAYGAGWGGSSNVTVAAGATLKVTGTGAATAFARAGGGPSIVDLKLESEDGSYGKFDLGGNVSVHTLRIGDTYLPAGDYGSTESGAANKNDDHFVGTGVLHVRRSGLVSALRFILR